MHKLQRMHTICATPGRDGRVARVPERWPHTSKQGCRQEL